MIKSGSVTEYLRSMILDILGMILDLLEYDSGYLKIVIWDVLNVAATLGPLFKKKVNNNNNNIKV